MNGKPKWPHYGLDFAAKKGTKISLISEVIDIPETIDVLIGEDPNEELNKLLAQSIGMAILDSGCTKTVCGEAWLELYIDTLHYNEKQSIVITKSSTAFKFGDGKLVPKKALRNNSTIAVIGLININILYLSGTSESG